MMGPLEEVCVAKKSGALTWVNEFFPGPPDTGNRVAQALSKSNEEKDVIMKNDMQSEAFQTQELTDGFHLVIDALKHNDIDTIFGLVGIPITDLARLAQAEGMRFIGFRHEQHAGNA